MGLDPSKFLSPFSPFYPNSPTKLVPSTKNSPSSVGGGGMTISDALVAHLTTLYLGVIAAVKAYGLATGRSFTGVFVLAASTAVVGAALIAALLWDVSRKATYAVSRERVREMCRGGICWHGVAVKSPVSQVQFRLPQHQHHQD